MVFEEVAKLHLIDEIGVPLIQGGIVGITRLGKLA